MCLVMQLTKGNNLSRRSSMPIYYNVNRITDIFSGSVCACYFAELCENEHVLPLELAKMRDLKKKKERMISLRSDILYFTRHEKWKGSVSYASFNMYHLGC